MSTVKPKEKIALLAEIPLFSGLDEVELKTLFDHAAIRRFPPNTIIINDGDESDSLYVIVSGKVKVFLTDDRGREVILNFQGAGEYLGEMALLSDYRRTASVMTLEPSQVIIITRPDFMRCISKYPTIALRVMRGLVCRLQELTEDVKGHALMNVYGRIARTLLKLAERKEGRLVVSQHLSRKDLASMVGSSREMVTRILKGLEKGGYLSMEGRKIIIHEPLPPGW